MSTITGLHRETFRTGSKTYYNSSLFFPELVKQEVYVLYGFVRVADNFVDQVPQNSEGFRSFVDRYRRSVDGSASGDPIIDPFVELCRSREFDPKWVEAFLHSMELDLTKRVYRSLDETLDYIYGSAEVIGLFMARILDLDDESYRFAKLQGRAMQYINFVRDIEEDRRLGRSYLPLDESGFHTLDETSARANPRQFERFIRDQIERYRTWQEEAEAGYRYIPRRYRVPIRTASDMYNWTASRIADDPFLVFNRQVKPGKGRVMLRALVNLVAA